MNLHLSDREKQTVTAALESFRSRKQAQIVASAEYKKDSPTYKELRQPENEHDILSCEHSLMHAITMLSSLTNQPIAHFANPNPSQLPQPKVHKTEGTGPVPTTPNYRCDTLAEAEAYFLANAGGQGVLCNKPDGSARACQTYPEAQQFYGNS